MSEENFIKRLKNELDVFTEEKQNEIIADYQKLITEKKEKGLSEEEAIKEIGLPETVAQKIYHAYGLKKRKHKGFFYKKFEELFEVIHHVVDTMAKNTMKENLKILVDILFLLFFIIIIKIPFIALENLGDSLLEIFNLPLLLSIWSFIVDFVYIIVAIMVFMNIFTKWFKNLQGKNKGEKIRL